MTSCRTGVLHFKNMDEVLHFKNDDSVISANCYSLFSALAKLGKMPVKIVALAFDLCVLALTLNHHWEDVLRGGLPVYQMECLWFDPKGINKMACLNASWKPHFFADRAG